MTEHAAEPSSTSPSTAVIDGVFELAREGHTGQLGEMLDAGVPLNMLNGRGDSLLIVASYAQHADTVRDLLRRGAATSVVNAMGQTAVACAVFRNNEAILRLLLEADADPALGAHPAAQIADQFGLPRMREVIESFGSAGSTH
ncbi:ankyrin repeat domain-containing protein [Cryobacterium melibiosiphilum]|nr:ankyrin repeat domain-containing protein [Cryobacterium melibiosiphilum]